MSGEAEESLRVDRRWSWAIAGAGVALFLLAASVYMEPRGIFEDEAAQISGLRLGPIRLVGWLTGGRPRDYGTPIGDRMPPLSYWVGWIWSLGFGLDETAMRALSALMTASAVLLVGLAAARWIGSARGAAAAVVLGLSPIVVAEGADIRPYGQFLALSALSVALWARALRSDPRATPRLLALLVAALILCMYTHFFGVVLTAALLGSGFLLHYRAGRPVRPWLIAVAITAVASVGLAPFVRGSLELSKGNAVAPDSSSDRKQMVRAIAQYFLPPVVSSAPPLLALGVGALGMLGIGWLGLLIGAARRREWPRHAEILLPLAIGWLSVAAIAGAADRFEPFRLTYNLWSMPLFAIALVVPLAATEGWVRLATRVGLAALILVDLLAAAECVRHRDWMGHGPDMAVRRAVAGRGPGGLALVHDVGPWFRFASIPASLEFGDELRQYGSDGSSEGTIQLLPDEGQAIAPESLDVRSIVVVRLDHVSWRQLRGRAPGPVVPPIGPVASRLASHGWRLVDSEDGVALGDAGTIWFLGVRLEVYERPETQAQADRPAPEE